jgi:hypothetical protein
MTLFNVMQEGRCQKRAIKDFKSKFPESCVESVIQIIHEL